MHPVSLSRFKAQEAGAAALMPRIEGAEQVDGAVGEADS